jgi:putative transposase
LFKPRPKTGRPREHSYREILNAIFYVIRTGCQWRNVPKDFPPWSVIYTYYRNWILTGFWRNLNASLCRKLRLAKGRTAKPSAAILDSQTVKSTECNEVRGYDAGKKINGSKRHLVVDTLGLVLMVMVTTANVQDRDAAQGLLAALFEAYGTIRLVWADRGYAGELVQWVKDQFRKCLDIVKPPTGTKGFHVQRKRWIVERTFGWLGRWRRLSKNYERKIDTAEALVYISMTHLMLRRLAKS